MFTGIVEELGVVTEVQRLSDAARLTIVGPTVSRDAHLGDSVAVSGVCLTVTSIEGNALTFDVMRETLSRSSLADVNDGDRVNLERPVTLSTRLGGHLVQGHVDGVGRILEREQSQHWEVVRISVPDELRRYLVAKGSITVDGVSLTVVEVVDGIDHERSWFSVSLIPTTLEVTTLGHKAVGDPVNLEVDVLAKYVERLLTIDRNQVGVQ